MQGPDEVCRIAFHDRSLIVRHGRTVSEGEAVHPRLTEYHHEK
jgi:hypothetical protein